MAEISRALSVPVSTLYQWAARGHWRQADLIQEVLPAAPEMDAGPAGNPIDEDGEPPTAVEAAEAALHPQPVGLPEAEAEQLRDDLRRKLFPRDRDLSQP
ncbi:hypothetical protein [Maricaulis salignorans]|uniref:Uncharacterized protein n=1 Tax=Maricaulis salignorans TaxID=144026 RepID=A0A1G9RLT5_9PROT|nr:hypothetical protein [Maricaulis salignorans]SDM24299.1 hypothetical protein SAMN04488568_10777 [Maricaulis salignorans]